MLSVQPRVLISELTGLWVLVRALDRPRVSFSLSHTRGDKRESFCVMEGKDTRRSSLESGFCISLCVGFSLDV